MLALAVLGRLVELEELQALGHRPDRGDPPPEHVIEQQRGYVRDIEAELERFEAAKKKRK